MSYRITPTSSTPRLYFRWWSDDDTAKTDGAAAAITAASYLRRSAGAWPASGTTVGTLTDGSEGDAYSVGKVIRHASADGLGNLYSIDPPTASTATGADAIRLKLTVSSGTVDVIPAPLDYSVGSRMESGEEVDLTTETIEMVAIAVRTELAVELARVDVATSTRATTADVAAGSVVVLPTSATAQERVKGTTITAFTGELLVVALVVRDADCVAVDLSAKELVLIVTDSDEVVVDTIADADITISGDDSNTATFTLTADMVASAGSYKWALRIVAANTVLGHGDLVVRYAANS